MVSLLLPPPTPPTFSVIDVIHMKKNLPVLPTVSNQNPELGRSGNEANYVLYEESGFHTQYDIAINEYA